MKKQIWIAALAAVWVAAASSQPGGKPPLVFVIHGPTIIAFSHPITQAELNNGEGDAEALGDFNFYLSKVEKRLREAGIEIQAADERSFHVRDGKKVRPFRAGKTGIGYYFIAPGREPHVESGVMTDEDLADAARKYFGIPIRRGPENQGSPLTARIAI
jgi:hypothetical protein